MKKLSALLLGLMLAAHVYAADSSSAATTAVKNQKKLLMIFPQFSSICLGLTCGENNVLEWWLSQRTTNK